MSGADAHKRPEKRPDELSGVQQVGASGHAGDVSAADTLADVASAWPSGATAGQRLSRQVDAESVPFALL